VPADDERDRWEARYAEAGGERPASPWILAAAQRVPQGVTIVDLAGGLGRHAVPLARAGRVIVLVDFVERAVRRATTIEPRVTGVVADLRVVPFARASLGAILVTNFLERDLVPVLTSLLAPGGYLIYETYTRDHLALVASGVARAPRSAQYTLEPGELRDLLAPLEILEYEEGVRDDVAGIRACASALARRPADAYR